MPSPEHHGQHRDERIVVDASDRIMRLLLECQKLPSAIERKLDGILAALTNLGAKIMTKMDDWAVKVDAHLQTIETELTGVGEDIDVLKGMVGDAPPSPALEAIEAKVAAISNRVAALNAQTPPPPPPPPAA